MPRAPFVPTPNTLRIGGELREWLHSRRLTQTHAVPVLGVSQPTISRAVHGRLGEDDPSLNILCTNAGIALRPGLTRPGEAGADRPLPAVLTNALRRLWDGTQESTDRVSRLLDAVATIRGATDLGGERG